MKWDRGEPPAFVPENRTAGTPDCIANGERASEAIDPSTLIDGFPPLCFVALTPEESLWQKASSYHRCSVQRFYARVIEAMYQDAESNVLDAFDAFLGPSVAVKVHPQRHPMPSVTTAVHADFSIAVIDGTRDFQTLALQAAESIRRPSNLGVFGTLPLWWQASEWIHDFLRNDGASPEKPVMLAGHSYGGAAAAVLAGRYRHANVNRLIRYLTYGCPKPGDINLRLTLNLVEGMNLQNHNDIISMYPPDPLTVQLLALALLAPQIGVWEGWVRPPGQMTLHENGDIVANDNPAADFAVLEALTQDLLDHEQIAPVIGHSIPEYARRIELRCPGVEWPIDALVNLKIKGFPHPHVDAGGIDLDGQCPGAGAGGGGDSGGIDLGGDDGAA